MRRSQCDRCGQKAMVNLCTKDGKRVGEFCGECFDEVDHDRPDRSRAGGHQGGKDNDPGFDNVIRALEEDR